MVYLELVAGIALLIVGGDLLVRGAVSTARHLGVSPLLIGLTLVGFGTSTPELVTSVEAALIGSPGIAIGNVVGSNIANILLILGVAALLRPIDTPRGTFRRDGGMVLLATIACTAVVLVGYLSRPAGGLLVALLIAYIIYSYRNERASSQVEQRDSKPLKSWLAVFFVAAGLAIVIIGARILVLGAIHFAETAGVSETIIGLTIVAVGTSLPELITSVIAAIRKESDVAFGNVIGSNIYNVFGIMGVTALVHPIPIPPEIIRLDIWIMVAATVLLLAFTATSWRLTRIEGAALLTAYTSYIGYLAYLA